MDKGRLLFGNISFLNPKNNIKYKNLQNMKRNNKKALIVGAIIIGIILLLTVCQKAEKTTIKQKHYYSVNPIIDNNPNVFNVFILPLQNMKQPEQMHTNVIFNV